MDPAPRTSPPRHEATTQDQAQAGHGEHRAQRCHRGEAEHDRSKEHVDEADAEIERPVEHHEADESTPSQQVVPALPDLAPEPSSS
jgi:hypothetical protein